MTSITHRLAETGDRCAYCGEPIPPNENQDALWQTGDPVAVIRGVSFQAVSFRVGKNDSNPRCSPSASSPMSFGPSTTRQEPQTNASDAD